MRRIGLVAAVLSSAWLAACEGRTTLRPAPITLTPTPVLLRGPGPLAAPGPTHDLCLEVPEFAPSYRGTWAASAPESAQILVKSVAATVQAALVRADGTREPLPTVGQRHGEAFEICFEAVNVAVDGQRAYAAVELWASGPVELRRATWWSGKRTKLL